MTEVKEVKEIMDELFHMIKIFHTPPTSTNNLLSSSSPLPLLSLSPSLSSYHYSLNLPPRTTKRGQVESRKNPVKILAWHAAIA